MLCCARLGLVVEGAVFSAPVVRLGKRESLESSKAFLVRKLESFPCAAAAARKARGELSLAHGELSLAHGGLSLAHGELSLAHAAPRKAALRALRARSHARSGTLAMSPDTVSPPSADRYRRHALLQRPPLVRHRHRDLDSAHERRWGQSQSVSQADSVWRKALHVLRPGRCR